MCDKSEREARYGLACLFTGRPIDMIALESFGHLAPESLFWKWVGHQLVAYCNYNCPVPKFLWTDASSLTRQDAMEQAFRQHLDVLWQTTAEDRRLEQIHRDHHHSLYHN